VFERLFPELARTEIDRLFNRFLAIITLRDMPGPALGSPGTVAILPMARFPDAGASPPPAVSIEPELGGRFPAFGRVTHFRSDATSIVIRGWGGLRYPPPRGSIRLRTGLPIRFHRVRLLPTPDLVSQRRDPSLLFSGFEIVLDLAGPLPWGATLRRPCVVIEDPLRGTTWVEDPGSAPECGDLRTP
jgi:hypothetical protein